MRIPRMTTRHWILAVAVVAVALWGGRLAERRAYYLTRAEVEADRAYDYAAGNACLCRDKDTQDPRRCRPQ
jgi:hypothetical protein